MPQELGFWLTVAIVAIVSVIAFKLGGGSPLGQAIPGYEDLAAVI